ncbi:MAG: DUF2207 domain-containing protein [Alphaproteobacteria bacterium]
MKKLFLTICFLCPFVAHSAVRSISSIQAAQQIKFPDPVDRAEIFSDYDEDDWNNLLVTRFEKANIKKVDRRSLGRNSATSVVPSDEALAAKNKEEKSLFDKMYDDAVNRLLNKNTVEVDTEVADFAPLPDKLENKKKDFATIDINIPFISEPVEVPARPHIPYFFSDIEVLSNGYSLIEENIVVLNNEGAPYLKVFNKFLSNRNNEKRKIDLEIVEVLINGEPVNYVQKEVSNKFVFKPSEDIVLPSGVFEYKFKYIIKNNLSFYDKNDEFFFNVTGINALPITRAGFAFSIPQGLEVINQIAFKEFQKTFSQDNIVGLQNGNTSIYISKDVIASGGGFYLISSIKKDGLISPDFIKRFWNFIDTHSDVLFAFMGFAVILIAYMISLKSLSEKISKQKLNIKKTPAMMRLLSFNICDIRSLISLFLDLYRKGVVDIIKNDDTLLLVKKTDSQPNLSKYEKLAMAEIFANKESVLSITSYNHLKLKRALQQLQKGLQKTLRNFVYKLNSRYLLFSFSMLLVSVVAISLGHLNIYQVFASSLTLVGLFILFCLLYSLKIKNKILAYTIKTISVLGLLLMCFWLSNIIGYLASIFVLLSVVVIFVFSNLFVKRSGLLQNYIKEALEYKSFLIKSLKGNISDRDLQLQQASIFALEVEFNKEELSAKKSNKLDLAQEILNVYNRKK